MKFVQDMKHVDISHDMRTPLDEKISICQSLLCLDLVSFPVLSQTKPQAPLLVVPFRQFL